MRLFSHITFGHFAKLLNPRRLEREVLIDTIEISGLFEAVVQGVSDRAKAVGTTAEEYIRYLIEEDLSSSSLNLRVLFAPVREQIKGSGTSGDELNKFLEEAREKVLKKSKPKSK